MKCSLLIQKDINTKGLKKLSRFITEGGEKVIYTEHKVSSSTSSH